MIVSLARSPLISAAIEATWPSVRGSLFEDEAPVPGGARANPRTMRDKMPESAARRREISLIKEPLSISLLLLAGRGSRFHSRLYNRHNRRISISDKVY